MRRSESRRAGAGRAVSSLAPAWAGFALLSAVLSAAVGCNQDEARRAFRSAASSELESGVKSINNGIISGLFEVFRLGTDQ